MEKPELSEFKKCEGFIGGELCVDPGLDARYLARAPYGHCVILINKHYEGIPEKTVILQCRESERLYRMVVDGDTPVLTRAQKIAERAMERYGEFGITVEVLTEKDLL